MVSSIVRLTSLTSPRRLLEYLVSSDQPHLLLDEGRFLLVEEAAGKISLIRMLSSAQYQELGECIDEKSLERYRPHQHETGRNSTRGKLARAANAGEGWRDVFSRLVAFHYSCP